MAIRSLVFLMILMMFPQPGEAADPVRRLVALGDSLTAGYGLQPGEDFVSQLQAALRKDGVLVTIDNAGVSGDTSAGGLSRLEWAVSGDPPPELVIVALGANDMLRGIDPAETKKNLSAILTKLKNLEIKTLLVGMKSPTNLGPLYQRKFDSLYEDLADEYDVELYPFFLEGVAMKPELNQNDGLHPNKEGVAVMVKNMLEPIKDLLEEK